MIRQISYKNFRSLQDVTIGLTPLNVFVGANNSGKSNALLALAFLQQLFAEGDLQRACAGINCTLDTLITRGKDSCTVSVSGVFGDTEVKYTIEFDRRGTGTDSLVATSPSLNVSRNNAGNTSNYALPNMGFSAPLGALMRFLRREPTSHVGVLRFCDFVAELAIFDLSVPALRRASELVVNPALSRSGDNLAAVLDWLRDNHPDRFDLIEKDIRSAARDIKSVSTRTTQPGTKVLALQQKDGQMYDASVLSDGLVMFVGLAVAAYSRTSPTLIAVEEPERGIHPRRLRDVLDAFRRVSSMGTQLVLTTHSPIVLDAFRDDPESVFVFDIENSQTRVSRLADKPAVRNLKDVSLGDAWYSGILDGLPPP